MSRKQKSLASKLFATLSKYSSPIELFTKLHPVFLYGWIPAVVYMGMSIEPQPGWMDLINILE